MAAHSAPWTPRRAGLLVDAGLAVAAFALSIGLLAAGDDGLTDDGGQVKVAAILLTAARVAAARRAPPRAAAVFVLTALASTALRADRGARRAAGRPDSRALHGWRRPATARAARQRLTLSLVAVLLAAHVAASGWRTTGSRAPSCCSASLVWGGVWLAGDRARLRQERMAALEERALRAERDAERERRLAAAEERMRIARDLHDSAGHAINVILVHAGARAAPGGAGPRRRARRVRDDRGGRARDGRRHRRACPRPARGRHERRRGGAAARRRRARGARRAPPGRGPGRHARPSAASARRSRPGVDRGAYRIVQEALTNAARHGDGSAQVEVAFAPGALELAIVEPRRPRRRRSHRRRRPRR